MDSFEELDGLEPGPAGNDRALPESLHQGAIARGVQIHVGGQHVGHATDFAAAHGVGLTGQGKRPHAGSPDAPREQMTVDQAVDLVGPRARLVDALRKGGHDPLGAGEELVEVADALFVHSTDPGDGAHVATGVERDRQGLPRPRGVVGDELRVDRATGVQIGQQSVEERDVGARPDRQVQVGRFTGGGPARVDDDQLHARPPLPGLQHALIQDGMAPGGVGADQDDEVRQLEVLVAAGHEVTAERPLVPGNGRGHAQTRVRIDVGGADETLHQLVGDVVVLGQQLPGHVEGHGVGTVLANDALEAARDLTQRCVPRNLLAVDVRMEKAPFGAHSVRQGSALGAQAPEVGWVTRVAAYLDVP